MLTRPPSERDAGTGAPTPEPACRFPVPHLAQARKAGVHYDLLIAAATAAMKRRHPPGNLPLWWTLLSTAPATPGEPWPIESMRVDTYFYGYLGVVVRAVLNTADQVLEREDLFRILDVQYARQVLASSPNMRIEPIACGFNLLNPDYTAAAFVGRRFEVSDSRGDRLSGIKSLLSDLAHRHGVSISLKLDRTAGYSADYSCRVFGYRDTMHRLVLTVDGVGKGSVDGRHLHAEIVDIVYSYNAHEGHRTMNKDMSERRLVMEFAADIVFVQR